FLFLTVFFSFSLLLCLILRPPLSTLFPYTTLFRSFLISGYKSSPLRVISNNHAIWLIPAIFHWILSVGISSDSSKSGAQTCTLWQRPTVFMFVNLFITPVNTAIGFV